MARLEDWCLITKLPSPYSAPEQGITCLAGKVYEHPSGKWEEGKRVLTSALKTYDAEKDCFITQSGTEYTLGVCNEEYEGLYPNCRARLVAQLNKV